MKDEKITNHPKNKQIKSKAMIFVRNTNLKIELRMPVT